MAFDLVFSQEAIYQLKRLDNKTAARIIAKLESSAKEPLKFFVRLSGREEFKLRIGDYRAIANIMQKEKKLFVRTLGHRKNIYKK